MLILGGTFLLMLPLSSSANQPTDFVTALFTATSAGCVTGLVVKDTATYWSVFGQAVILILIQIGGLGFMTISFVFFRLMRSRISLHEKEMLVDSLNITSLGGTIKFDALILKSTLAIEGVGALLLALRFVPDMGLGYGLWAAVFHSVSAFCNAGFDIMGTVSGPYSSLCAYADDPLVILTIGALIVIGGLGFIVYDDIRRHGLHFSRYNLHTKIVLIMTLVLIGGGTAAFMIMEYGFTNAGLPVGQQLLNSLFDSITPRTAGFNSVDTASLSNAGKFFTMLLMFIGGSPGSTAGGIKTTTVAVLFAYVIASLRGLRGPHAYSRSFTNGSLHKAVTVAFFNVTLVLTGIVIISIDEPLISLTDICFEAFSAIGTVGLTTGITRSLDLASRLVIIALMYLGRVGSTSFATALLERRALPPVTYPDEDIIIG